LRPPRYLWPFHSEHSNFWQPLGFASIAAVVREKHPDIDIRIYDLPVMKWGWKTAKLLLEKEKPDIICVGDETVSSSEANPNGCQKLLCSE